jgi:MerR family copper efflux transcriptional regulator
MNIGAAAARSGLPPKTIRYYEEIGLVQPARAGNGYRDYGVADVAALRFLRQARALGFSVDECRRLLSLWADAGRESAQVKALAENHLADIDRRIAGLRVLRTRLAILAAQCRGDGSPDCAIIDALAAPETEHRGI